MCWFCRSESFIEALKAESLRIQEEKKELQKLHLVETGVLFKRITELEKLTLDLVKKQEFNVRPPELVEQEKKEIEEYDFDEDQPQDNYSRALRLASESVQETTIVGQDPPQIKEEV